MPHFPAFPITKHLDFVDQDSIELTFKLKTDFDDLTGATGVLHVENHPDKTLVVDVTAKVATYRTSPGEFSLGSYQAQVELIIGADRIHSVPFTLNVSPQIA